VTRVRWALALLAFLVGVPVALLVARALAAERFETEVQHQVVAERAFDEMERALSVWLAEEEARPFEAYAWERPAGAPPSPLEGAPGAPFVLAYFQIDPDGTLRSPRSASEAPEARARAAAELAEVRGALDRALSAPLASRDREDTLAAEARSALELAKQAPPPAGQKKKERDPAESDESASAYELLDRLNLGGRARQERSQKVAVQRYGSPEAPQPPTPSARQLSEWEALAPREAFLDDAKRDAGAASEAEEEVDAGRVASSAVARVPAAAPAPPLVVVDPMVARAAGPGELLLYRTVWVGERGYRQGLLLAGAPLGEWLRDRVLGESGLAEVARFASALSPMERAPDASHPYAYAHRFAEPFDALHASLALAPLPGAGGPGVIHALSALVLVLGGAGLFAVYRMVALALQFAERRSNFVAAVSHELKTPVTAIRMYAEMLRDGLVPSETKRDEYYSTIGDESERLSRLIDNVLEFSKLERDQRQMQLRVGSLGEAVAEACATLRPHAERQGFALELACEPELPPVRFDADALVQVVFNLVDNALKYAAAAERKVVQVECRREAGGVRLSVRDYGPGVAAQDRGRIFEPFHRGGSELTRTTQGAGIGLALVRELSERMGARVAAHAPEGGGLEVRLAFAAA
jgi:signal transduction histidine kinase